MEFHSNLEIANWVPAKQNLLHLSGWALARDGWPLHAIRLCSADKIVSGYYGIQRPDVRSVHSDQPNAMFSGFSFLLKIDPASFPVKIEAMDRDHRWHKVLLLASGTITRQPAPAPTTVELTSCFSEGITTPEEADASKPVLFISHDFAAAGAQMLLVRLLQWLRKAGAFPFEILIAVPRGLTTRASKAEQTILAAFHAAGAVHFISDLTRAPENLNQIRQGRYRLIYANTGTLGWLLPALRPFPCPVITHVHELSFWLEKRVGLEIFARQAACTDRFIACSTPVRDYLTGRPTIQPDKIDVIHDCGSTARALLVRRDHNREGMRHTLGIPEGAFVVAACGTFDWRKGADLFVPVCVALERKLRGQKFHAFWIGGEGTDLALEKFAFEVEKAGLSGRVSLLGHQSEPLRWMLAADCFALLSREDPFPIVMLEAGVLGLPVVGFQGSGGVTEFVGTDAGIVVPYLDVEAFAGALAELAADDAAARRMGQVSAGRVTRLYDENISFQRILNLIDSVAANTLPPR